MKPTSLDFTDKEAVATIVRVTRGNIRLIERLMMQVETAQQNLIIGPN